jgi:uncharacterized membrane protein YhiD involved in acid resistance
MTTPIWLMKVFGWLKLAGAWLKGHWYVLVIAAGLIYASILAKNKSTVINDLLKELREQQTRNSKQLDELRKIQHDQIVRQQEINAKYNEVLNKIQKDYQDQLRNLDSQKEADLRNIIATNKDDPSAMARDINILFGIPIYPGN